MMIVLTGDFVELKNEGERMEMGFDDWFVLLGGEMVVENEGLISKYFKNKHVISVHDMLIHNNHPSLEVLNNSIQLLSRESEEGAGLEKNRDGSKERLIKDSNLQAKDINLLGLESSDVKFEESRMSERKGERQKALKSSEKQKEGKMAIGRLLKLKRLPPIKQSGLEISNFQHIVKKTILKQNFLNLTQSNQKSSTPNSVTPQISPLPPLTISSLSKEASNWNFLPVENPYLLKMNSKIFKESTYKDLT